MAIFNSYVKLPEGILYTYIYNHVLSDICLVIHSVIIISLFFIVRSIWRFPEMWIAPNHPKLDHFSIF